jgi:hypothetical protein
MGLARDGHLYAKMSVTNFVDDLCRELPSTHLAPYKLGRQRGKEQVGVNVGVRPQPKAENMI